VALAVFPRDLRAAARLLLLATLAGPILAACGAGNGVPHVSRAAFGEKEFGVKASPRVTTAKNPPKGGGRYMVGKPYTVRGKVYEPIENPIGYAAVGSASWYGNDFHGRATANGEIYDMAGLTAAHPTLPLPSYVRVTNLKNSRSIVVRVNDRGPYAHNRLIDLSYRTATLLGFHGHGVAKVRVEYIGRAPIAGSDDRKLEATLRDPAMPKSHAPVQVASAENFAPAYFDPQPMSRTAAIRDVPSPPPSRPYAADTGPTTELAANRRGEPDVPPSFAQRYAVASSPAPEPITSRPFGAAVSAFAPVRYDAPAGFMSGRGLY
jgi:rare lipoprotein A